MRKTADVVVIGGGNAGTSVAYHLAKAGIKNVVLVEQKYTPFGGSGRCAAMFRQQFASGLDYVFGIEPSNLIYIVTLALVTASYTLSSGRGIKKGMALISNINTYIYIFLIAFLFIFGDTVFDFKLLTASIGQQIENFIPNVFSLDPTNEGNGWFQGWTVFYMA